MQTSPSVIASIESEITRLTGLLDQLKQTKLSLEMGRVASVQPKAETKPIAKAQPKPIKAGKKPYGTVVAKLIEVVERQGKASNAEVRAALDSEKFKYSNAMAVRKALYKLAKAGKLREVKEEDAVRYTIPEKVA